MKEQAIETVAHCSFLSALALLAGTDSRSLLIYFWKNEGRSNSPLRRESLPPLDEIGSAAMLTALALSSLPTLSLGLPFGQPLSLASISRFLKSVGGRGVN